MPAGSGPARVIIFASVGCSLVSFLLSCLILLNLTVRQVPVSPYVVAGQRLFALAGAVLFVLFLRSTAQSISRGDLASKAVTVLVLGVLMFVAVVVLLVGPQLLGPAIVASLAMLVLSLAMLISYGNLLTYLRKAVAEFADAGGQVEEETF
jgi:hypothetical protein